MHDRGLRALTVSAALATGWPCLLCERRDEASVVAAQAALEAILGPLPQADVLVPLDDEPWALRVVLPGLTPEAWLAVDDALDGAVSVEPALPRGLGEWADRGRAVSEVLDGGWLTLERWTDVEGGVVRPDLYVAPSIDAAAAGLEYQLAVAVRTVSPTLSLDGGRGPDTVDPVVHRPSGRFGLRLRFSLEPVAERAPIAVRQAVVEALAPVVRDAAAEPARLAPDGWWDERHGVFEAVLWLVGPPAPALPGEARVHGAVPDAYLVGQLANSGLCSGFTAQVVPSAPQTLTDAIAWVAARAEASLIGDLPRWVVGPAGSPALASCWYAPVDDPPDALLDDLDASVAGVRLLPWPLAGLEDEAPGLDPRCWFGRERALIQVRCPLRDRDLVAEVDERPPEPSDAAVLAGILAALHAHQAPIPDGASGTPFVPVRDRSGRAGWAVRFGVQAWGEDRFTALRTALLDAPLHGVAPLAMVAFTGEGALVHLWSATTGDQGERTWR